MWCGADLNSDIPLGHNLMTMARGDGPEFQTKKQLYHWRWAELHAIESCLSQLCTDAPNETKQGFTPYLQRQHRQSFSNLPAVPTCDHDGKFTLHCK